MFFAIHLAVDAGFKVTNALAATATLVVTMSRSATATSTMAATMVVSEVTSPTFGGNIDGRVRSTITDLMSLLITYKLGLKFLKGDGVRAVGHTGHDRIKLLPESHKDVGHDLIVISPAYAAW